jgi:hypothetical protein
MLKDAVNYVKAKERISICDYYGSHRTGKQLELHKLRSPLEINIQSWTPRIVEGDKARSVQGSSLKQADVIFICDVYWSSLGGEDDPMVPEDLEMAFDKTSAKVGYIVCRTFKGLFGGDVVGDKVEGSWYRRDLKEDGEIVFFPDPDAGSSYHPHQPLDLPDHGLWAKGDHAVQVENIRTFGPYSLYRFTRDTGGIVPRDVISRPGNYRWMSLDGKDLIVASHKLPEFAGHHAIVRGATQQSVMQKVQSALRKDPVFLALETNDHTGEWCRRIIDDTTYAAMHLHRGRVADSFNHGYLWHYLTDKYSEMRMTRSLSAGQAVAVKAVRALTQHKLATLFVTALVYWVSKSLGTKIAHSIFTSASKSASSLKKVFAALIPITILVQQKVQANLYLSWSSETSLWKRMVGGFISYATETAAIYACPHSGMAIAGAEYALGNKSGAFVLALEWLLGLRFPMIKPLCRLAVALGDANAAIKPLHRSEDAVNSTREINLQLLDLKIEKSTMPMYLPGQDISWKELWDLAKAYERPGSQQVYWFVNWWTDQPKRLIRPANTAVNKMIAVNTRLFRDLKADRVVRLTNGEVIEVTSERMIDFWGEAFEYFKEEFKDSVVRAHGQDALPKDPKKRKKFEAAQRDIDHGSKYYRKNINLKHNEVLASSVEAWWYNDLGHKVRKVEYDFKPRAIVDLAETVHVLLSPFSKGLTTWFHRVVDGRIFDLGWTRARFYFTSGGTVGPDLMATLLNESFDGFTVFVCGDDSLIFGPDGVCTNDYSAFDSTQGAEVFETFTIPLLRHLFGAAWKDVDRLFKKAVSGDFTTEIKFSKTESLTVSGSTGYQMPTGITFTSILSTIHNMAAIAISLRRCGLSYNPVLELKHDFPIHVASSGFIAKPNWFDTVEGADYLRHLVIQDENGFYRLYPMPSAVFKMMKSIVDPQSKKRGGYEAVLWMTAQCYKHVPYTYPVVGTLLKSLSGLEEPKDSRWSPQDIHEDWEYKLISQNCEPLPHPDQESVERVFVDRYGSDLSGLDISMKFLWHYALPNKQFPIDLGRACWTDVEALMSVDY